MQNPRMTMTNPDRGSRLTWPPYGHCDAICGRRENVGEMIQRGDGRWLGRRAWVGEEGSSRGARNSCGTTKTRRITKLATNGPRSDSDAADQHGHRRWRDHGSPGGLATWDAADPLGALCMHIRSIKNIVGEWTDGSSFCLGSTYELAWYPATKCAQTSFNSVDSTATLVLRIQCDLSKLLSFFRPKYFSSHLHSLGSDTPSSPYPYYGQT